MVRKFLPEVLAEGYLLWRDEDRNGGTSRGRENGLNQNKSGPVLRTEV